MKKDTARQTHYYANFKEMLEDLFKKYSDKTAITYYKKGKEKFEKTYTELKEDSFRFAGALFNSGLAGKNTAIISENSYEWLTAYFGIAVSGGVSVCIDIDHSDDIIKKMLERADVEIVLASPSMAVLLKDICADLNIKMLIEFGNEHNNIGVNYSDFCRDGDSDEAKKKIAEYTPDTEQTVSIVYTSGTTSMAKPVMLSNRSILSNAAGSLTLLDSREKVFNSLPLYHTYGLTCGILCAIMRGLNVCISCDLRRLTQELANFKPNLLIAVPLIIEVIHKSYWGFIEKAEKKDYVIKRMGFERLVHKYGSLIGSEVKKCIKGTAFEELDTILSGGAYLSKTIAEDMLHFGVVVLQGYGATECSPSITCNESDDFSLDSVGVLLPGNEVKIVDDEIYVKGNCLMNGYYKAEELTKEAFDDGWFKTGDLGYMDKKGHLHIVGRKKNLIVMKNGKKIAVEEMEQRFKEMPLVKEVMIHGTPSGGSMDDVKIAATVYPDPMLTENMSRYEILEKLQEFVSEMNKTLPFYKQIQMINIQETEFDKTSVHKIKRNLL
ncbi:MAG: AMP-binding protein [Candidatus Metalachnospira sp.]|nr:AMP-binding protein [Candidatus Metalachnospira sp.]